MKVPFSWLKRYVDIDVTPQQLEEKLFSCGVRGRGTHRPRGRNQQGCRRRRDRGRPPGGHPPAHLQGGLRQLRPRYPDLDRRAERLCRHAHPGRARRRNAARRHQDQGQGAARRRIQRHALLGRGTRPQRRPLPRRGEEYGPARPAQGHRPPAPTSARWSVSTRRSSISRSPPTAPNCQSILASASRGRLRPCSANRSRCRPPTTPVRRRPTRAFRSPSKRPTSARATSATMCATSRRARPRSGCGATLRCAGCAASRTSSISPTTSCSKSASRCTPLIWRRSKAAASSSRRAKDGETITTLRRQGLYADPAEPCHLRRRKAGRAGRRHGRPQQRDHARKPPSCCLNRPSSRGTTSARRPAVSARTPTLRAHYEKGISEYTTELGMSPRAAPDPGAWLRRGHGQPL